MVVIDFQSYLQPKTIKSQHNLGTRKGCLSLFTTLHDCTNNLTLLEKTHVFQLKFPNLNTPDVSAHTICLSDKFDTNSSYPCFS